MAANIAPDYINEYIDLSVFIYNKSTKEVETKNDKLYDQMLQYLLYNCFSIVVQFYNKSI